jgi:hypothetical protein
MLLFLPLLMLVAWICHAQRWGFAVACVVGTVANTLLAWALTASHFGWFDDTFYQNLFLTAMFSFAITVATGTYRRARLQKRKDFESSEAGGHGSS